MKSNQDRSKEIARRVRIWIRDRDAQGDSSEWIQTSGPTAFKGVKRKKLAETLGVSTTTLNENVSSVELRNAEFRWCQDYLRKQETSNSASSELKRTREGKMLLPVRDNAHKDNNSELKAENLILRSRLAKWEAFEKVLLDTGRAPRGAFSED